MKRRIFSVLLSSALLLTALAGCGQGGEADPSGSPSDAESETATRDELIFVNYRDRVIRYNMGLVSNYLLAVLQKFSNGDASCYCSPICGYASCDSYLVYFCRQSAFAN